MKSNLIVSLKQQKKNTLVRKLREKLKQIKQKRIEKKRKIIFLIIQVTMQRDISKKNTSGETLYPYDDAPKSTAIDRTASNSNDAKEKVQKIETLLTGENMTQMYQHTYLVSLN